ncbi:HIT family protein [Zoogloea sp.]|uniref:HIT family protein n=1 Tax=Zoogloea sp. TaxID=49181 RepID=UPI00262286E2|nr:HIT family protein [Zoogloea sp.]MDD3352464.1 HIT family protein [Zoogloea sp.]
MPNPAPKDCPLCFPEHETVLWQDASCRVIQVADEDYPGYCRLIWNNHVAEMSDLTPFEQRHCFNILMAVEVAVRECFQPDKINLASFGNMVPHLHWHVIPRYLEDRHFPQPIWGQTQRKGLPSPAPAVDTAHLATAIRNAIAEQIAG